MADNFGVITDMSRPIQATPPIMEEDWRILGEDICGHDAGTPRLVQGLSGGLVS